MAELGTCDRHASPWLSRVAETEIERPTGLR
jgi:hypothetical protein